MARSQRKQRCASGQPTLLTAAISGLLVLPSCSVLFGQQADDGGGDAADAGVAVDGGPGADAMPLVVCGPPMMGTIAYFPFEADADDTTLTNTADSARPGTSMRLGASGAPLLNNPLAVAAGPDGCGQGAELDANNREVLRFDNGALTDVQAVDFWLLLDGSNSNQSRLGILSKDSMSEHNGDTELSLVESSVGDASHLVMRIQRLSDADGTAKGSFYLCSKAITFGVWHHVAVSADGIAATFFLDGEKSEEDISIVPPFSGGAMCNQGANNARGTLFFENSSNWIMGGNTAAAPGVTARDFISGQIDEVRFRKQPFTSEEAMNVYGIGRVAIDN